MADQPAVVPVGPRPSVASGGAALTLAELDRLRAVAAAAQVLAGKVVEHHRRGYDHIRLGACQPLLDALNGTTTTPMELDVPEPRQLHDEDSCALWLSEAADAACTCHDNGGAA